MKLWATCLGFLRDSFETHGEETLLWLMYNYNTGIWDAWAPPQIMRGMTVSADIEDEDFHHQRSQWGNGWVVGGTMHHHCTTAAFASGTDNADEINKDGIHFTFGKMKEPTLDSDARLLYRGEKYKATVGSFVNTEKFELELSALGLTSSSIDPLVETMLCSCCDYDYPNKWLENLKKRVIIVEDMTPVGESLESMRARGMRIAGVFPKSYNNYNLQTHLGLGSLT